MKQRTSPRSSRAAVRASAWASVLGTRGEPPPRCSYISRAIGARRADINLASKKRIGCGKPIIALSLNRLNKNGWTDSGLSGPPRLNRTMARRLFSMASDIGQTADNTNTAPLNSSVGARAYRRDQRRHMLGRCLWYNPVAQIKNKPSFTKSVAD